MHPLQGSAVRAENSPLTNLVLTDDKATGWMMAGALKPDFLIKRCFNLLMHSELVN